LGSEKVGKTLLAHKLVDLDYLEEKSTTQCQKYIKELAEKHEALIYYDYPPINRHLIEDLTHGHLYDMMVCLFKDSTSFGQLY
jgi:GTPase SAR1 family protein